MTSGLRARGSIRVFKKAKSVIKKKKKFPGVLEILDTNTTVTPNVCVHRRIRRRRIFYFLFRYAFESVCPKRFEKKKYTARVKPEAGICARLETTFLCAYRPRPKRLGATATDNRFCGRTHTESRCRTVWQSSVVEKELGGKSVFYVVGFWRRKRVCVT